MRHETAGRWLDWTEDKVLGVVAMACIGVLMLILAALAVCFLHGLRSSRKNAGAKTMSSESRFRSFSKSISPEIRIGLAI